MVTHGLPWGAIPEDHHKLLFECFKVTYTPLNELVQWLKWIAHVLEFFFFIFALYLISFIFAGKSIISNADFVLIDLKC